MNVEMTQLKTIQKFRISFKANTKFKQTHINLIYSWHQDISKIHIDKTTQGKKKTGLRKQ